MNKDLHQVQAGILKELLFHNGSTFASLNKFKIPNDHFTFHLKQLVGGGIVEKKEKLYFLTQEGKLFANKLDIFGLKMEKFGTPSVIVAAVKTIRSQKCYLIQERLKEPLYGYFGFLNGKIKFGETAEETAVREFKEETGLTGKPIPLAIHHWIRGPKRSQPKLDHYFFLFLIKNPRGKLKQTLEGKNSWKTVDEIQKLNTFPGFSYTLDVVTNEKSGVFREKFIKVDNI